MIPSRESPHKGKTGLKRVWNAFFYSLDGFKAAWKHEDAFRQDSLLALVLIVELVNSAIEATVDRISLENHKLAKRAKDIGSAAVLIALINALVMWGLVLLG